jgi:hypothetical protein
VIASFGDIEIAVQSTAESTSAGNLASKLSENLLKRLNVGAKQPRHVVQKVERKGSGRGPLEKNERQ